MEEGINMDSEEINSFNKLRDRLTVKEIRSLSPLQLAYVGDAVYELLIRTYLIRKGLSVKKLHKTAVEYVKAEAQSEFVRALEEELTEKEKNIVIRWRNAKSNSSPKNVDLMDYKYATGLETLIGYLFLVGDDERIFQLINKIINWRVAIKRPAN